MHAHALFQACSKTAVKTKTYPDIEGSFQVVFSMKRYLSLAYSKTSIVTGSSV